MSLIERSPASPNDKDDVRDDLDVVGPIGSLIDGRKIHVSADLHHGDTLCAQARAIFISMRPEVFEQLMSLRESRRSGA